MSRPAIIFWLPIFGRRGHDPNLEIRLDLLVELDLDRVQAEFLQGALEAYLVRLDGHALLGEDFGQTLKVHQP
jgi:hypothetical protein